MTDQATRPDIAEQYTNAMHTTNLRLKTDAPCAADILIAAAWSASRTGAALLRLHSEYDGAEHPRFSVEVGKEAYRHEVALLFSKLKSLPTVRDQIMFQADRWGIERHSHVCMAVLIWWLDRSCCSCHGTKLDLIGGRVSGRICKVCRGSGEDAVPCGEAGRKMANYIDDCLQRARIGIKKRLHPFKNGA